LSYLWDRSVVSCDLVLDFVDLVVFSVDCSDEHVVGDVLEVTTELQPRTGSRNVVGGALSLNLKNAQNQQSGSNFSHVHFSVRFIRFKT
jgi:hypothetical protein